MKYVLVSIRMHIFLAMIKPVERYVHNQLLTIEEQGRHNFSKTEGAAQKLGGGTLIMT